MTQTFQAKVCMTISWEVLNPSKAGLVSVIGIWILSVNMPDKFCYLFFVICNLPACLQAASSGD